MVNNLIQENHSLCQNILALQKELAVSMKALQEARLDCTAMRSNFKSTFSTLCSTITAHFGDTIQILSEKVIFQERKLSKLHEAVNHSRDLCLESKRKLKYKEVEECNYVLKEMKSFLNQSKANMIIPGTNRVEVRDTVKQASGRKRSVSPAACTKCKQLKKHYAELVKDMQREIQILDKENREIKKCMNRKKSMVRLEAEISCLETQSLHRHLSHSRSDKKRLGQRLAPPEIPYTGVGNYEHLRSKLTYNTALKSETANSSLLTRLDKSIDNVHRRLELSTNKSTALSAFNRDKSTNHNNRHIVPGLKLHMESHIERSNYRE